MRAAAFVTRSIRQDSRTISHHIMRAAVAGFILFIFMTQVVDTNIRVGAGASFSNYIFLCCYWSLTLLGGVHFSAAISEEREEQTLPLLKMTGASPLAILLGKSLPRLAVALLFLLSVAPFVLLAVTLGGVVTAGLISAILSILCYSLMLSQLGLLASIIGADSRRAFGWMALFWSLTELLSWWMSLPRGFGWISSSTYSEVVQTVIRFSLIQNLGSTLLAFSPSEWWFPHMTFQVLVSCVAFLLSLALFNRMTEERSSARWIPDLSQISGGGHGSRVWDSANEWKSWQLLGGGFRWMWIRAIGGIVVSIGLMAFLTSLFDVQFSWEPVFWGGFWIAMVLFLLSVGRMVGRVFQVEIQEKTLATLVMLPKPASFTFSSMLKGLIPSALASFVPVVVGFFALLMMVGRYAPNGDLGDLLDIFAEPWVWHFGSWTMTTYALAIFLSTRVRHGAFLIAIALSWFIAPMFFSFTMFIFFSAGPGGEGFFRYLLPILMIGGEIALSVGMLKATYRHLEQLAAR